MLSIKLIAFFSICQFNCIILGQNGAIDYNDEAIEIISQHVSI